MVEHATPDACPRCGYLLVQPPPPTAPPLAPAAPYPPYPARPAVPSGRPARGLGAASVPKLLLALGALCLLVAAAVFLAVAWSSLGVGGRTAVLVTLTVATAAGGQLLARRELTVAAEALTAVALGLLALDLVGAADAGWLGDLGEAGLVLTVGAALLTASLALTALTPRLAAPQLVAPLGLGLAALGTAHLSDDWPLLASLAVLGSAGLAVVGRGLRVLPVPALVAGLLAYAGLGVLALGEAFTEPTLRWLWLEGHGVWLVVAAGLALLPWAVVRTSNEARVCGTAFAGGVLTLAAAAPVLDDGLTRVALAACAAAVVWALVSAVTPPRWYAAPRVPLAGSLVVALAAPAVLAVQALQSLLTVAPPWTADAGVRLDPPALAAHPLLLPLGVAVALLAAALALPRTRRLVRTAGAVAAGTVLLTLALHPLPLAVPVLALGPLGLLVAWPSAALTLVPLVELVGLAAYLLVRGRDRLAAVGATVLPAALAGALWTAGQLLAQPLDHRSLAVVVALGLLAVAVPRRELDAVALLAGVVAGALGVPAAADVSVSLAVHLTLAGTVVTLGALVHRDRRTYAWLGGALLVLATWVRLLDVGVESPEPYTLPAALGLLAVGLHRMRRDPWASSSVVLTPGLVLAVVPTLLWALVYPLAPRAVVIGLVLLALVLAGSAVRWSAPLLVGWVGGAVLVLRELAPYAEQTPQWVLIGAAGTVLVAAGTTWEARLRDVRRTAAYLGRLR